jgi:non-ribosomal peptide synthase protein (TIGR01720 family)
MSRPGCGRRSVAADGRLRVTWIFSPALHRRSTIEALAAAFVEHLHVVLDPERTAAAAAPTTGDFPLARLAQSELDTIASMLHSASSRTAESAR